MHFSTPKNPQITVCCKTSYDNCLYSFICTRFGQLILGKIIKIVATRCQIIRLKCTKFDFGWGSAPDPAGGAYSAPPDPLAALRGPTSNGREGKGRYEGKGRTPLKNLATCSASNNGVR